MLTRTIFSRAALAPIAARRAIATTPRRFASLKEDGKSEDASQAPTQADDPWAIPLQHPGTAPEDIPVAYAMREGSNHPEGRAEDEPTESMRARLVYQSRKRGILEMEMLLSTFIGAGKLKNMSRGQMQEYDRLLTLPDWTIYYWCIGKKPIPDDSEWKQSSVLQELSKHARNEGKEMRRMPDVTTYGISQDK